MPKVREFKTVGKRRALGMPTRADCVYFPQQTN